MANEQIYRIVNSKIVNNKVGRNKYSAKEIKGIERLLRRKEDANRLQQKEIRHTLRTVYEFNISDFGEQGVAFGVADLHRCVERGIIKILDEATIEAMKAKRARDKERDAMANNDIAPDAALQ